MAFFLGYIGAWETGTPVALNVPTYELSSTQGGNNQTVTSATSNFPWFDNTYTMFVTNASNKQKLLNYGFPNVSIIDVSGGTVNIYLSPNKRVEVNTSARFRYYNGNTLLYNMQLIANNANSLAYSTDSKMYYMYLYNMGDITFGVEYNVIGAGILYDFWNGLEPIVQPTDPFAPGGESDIGGGTGDFDGTSVDVDFASLPTLSAVETGFITLYNPSLAQLQSLASYMWSGLFDIDTLKKLFADPMQAILGLSIVPGPVPSGGTQNVKIGNIDSGVVMTKASTQYIDVDCGTLNVEEFWGAYLDYEPYTKAEIFLPFIGVHQIAIDDIMNKSVHIKYHIDLLSGACACEIKCGGSVLYTFIGSCAVSIPITGNDWTNLLNGVLSAASAIGTMVATGGASAPSAASAIASAAVNSLKPSIEKSGSIAGAGGLLAGKVPVLILTRPRQALPGKQNTFTGYPAFITRSLGDLSGYTEVHSIRLSGIDGTESEIDEIEELLKGGVIL